MRDPVVVVGAGLGGLASAVALAAKGLPVHVVEAGPRPGGKAGIAVIDGVEVDTGPSVLTLPSVFEGLFRRAGADLHERVTLSHAVPACRYVFPEGPTVDLFDARDATRASVASALGATAARELDAFLDHAQGVWDAAAPWFVCGPAPTPARVAGMGPGAWAAVAQIDAFRTMDAAIQRFVHTRELRWILQRYATYNGSDPRQAPATLNCIAHVELGLGVYAVKGGIHALVRAIEALAHELGVVTTYDTPVVALHRVAGRLGAVELEDGRVLRASAVVANADASHVLRDLLPGTVEHGLDDDPPRSMSGWVGIVRAKRTDDRVGHTVLFPHAYEQEFVDIFDRNRPPAEPTVYLCAQSRCHDRPGWDDAEPIFAMANAPAEPADGTSDPQSWRDLEAIVRGRLVRHGLVAADDPIVWRRSPTGLAEAFPGTRGAIYGAASNDRFAAFKRPPNKVVRVPGLYLASGSAHPGGGMPLCALSGLAAADELVQDQRGGP